MKKIVLSSVLASSLLVGAEYNYEIAPMVGYVDTQSKVELDNYKMVGLGAYKNLEEDCKLDQLEIALLHGNNADYERSSLNTDVNLLMLNAIKEYKMNDTVSLYALAGFGYQQIKDNHFGNDSEGFFDYGIGAKFKVVKDYALKLDARHLIRTDGDQNILYTLGFIIPFGEKAAPAPIVQKVEEPEPAPTPKDSDNDGVIDENDKCPNTPAGVEVDSDGCAIIIKPVDLGIVFDTDSATIKSTDLEKFEKFVAYAKKVSDKGILIEAHTDNVGSEKYNMGLSHRRALSAKKQLVAMGIEEDRISTKGYGETKPKVPNTNAENRQINRRVEARITE